MLEYKNKYKWAISTISRGESDILEMFIAYYHNKVELLYIGLHNPSNRIIELIRNLEQRLKIKNLKLKIFNTDDNQYRVYSWVNDMYKNVIVEKNIDIYAHVDIDEFIYRFDLIEDNYKSNSIIKMPWVDVCRSNNNPTDRFLKCDQYRLMDPNLLSKWGKWCKTIYCIGVDKHTMFYETGQHDINFNGNGSAMKDVIFINYPCFYHFAYRNDIQTYLKISNILKINTSRSAYIKNSGGKHVLEKFLNIYSHNYIEIFENQHSQRFNININLDSLINFSNLSFDIDSNSNDRYPIDPFFMKNYFNKYYNEENSLLDFIEQDFPIKMAEWRDSYFRNAEFNSKKK